MKIIHAIKNILITGTILCFSMSRLSAQVDPHFSQYYAHPLWLNPALTGIIDGDYRASLNLKQQWGGLPNSFLTGGVSFDMAPVKQLAFGATILNQRAGDLDFNYLTAMVSGAYRVRFGNGGLNILNFGLQAGIINRSFDLSKAQFGGQYSPVTGYDPGVNSNESFSSSSALVPEVNAGIMYFDGTPDIAVNPFIGFSAAHLTRPVEQFLGNKERLPIRYTAHGGLRIRASEMLDLVPNGLFMYQGNTREISAGGYAQISFNNNSNLLIGGNYRIEDSAIAFLGLHIKNFTYGISYDVNTSSFRRATSGNGGFEISISYISRKGIIGPNFFCPRL